METPSTSELHDVIQIGLAGRDRENMGPTVAYFLALLAQHPGNAPLLFEVGSAYDAAGEEQQALGYYEQALAGGLEGDVLRRCLLQYGSTLRILGRHDASLAALDRARREFEDSDSVRLFFALSLHAAGRSDRAVGALLELAADRITTNDVQRYEASLRSNAAHLTKLDRRTSWGGRQVTDRLAENTGASGRVVFVTTDAPRVIGMLGGMSWESSAQYYRLANELVREQLGGLHSARIVLASVDFADVEALQIAGQWDEAGQLLAQAARGLEAAGADLLLICTNTMHKVADQVQDAVTIPLLHLGDATAQAVIRAGLGTVGLLGTAFTMEQDFYRDRLTSHGLRVLIPPAQDRAEVHRIIYDELCLGVIREESRQAYRDAIVRLVQAGAEGVVLGCTEIELLVSAGDSPVPIFPTTRLHVEAAVAASLATRSNV